jgi:hypothetical protein
MPTAREETTRLANLLRREHHALAEFLVALATFDRERRWVELGYSSLFYFLTRELGLPKGPAYYRKTAAELIQRYPEIIEPLRDGRLNLSTITELANVITPENCAEVLPRFFGTSRREAKEVVAELQPVSAPPLRSVVTALPVASASPALLSESPRVMVGVDAPGTSGGSPGAVRPGPLVGIHGSCGSPEEPPACQVSVTDGVPRLALRAEPTRVEPLTAELTRLHVTVSRRLLAKLAAARDALSHSHPGAADDAIIEVGLDLVIDRYRKRRGIGVKPRGIERAANVHLTEAGPSHDSSASPGPALPERSRHVPATVWRAVWDGDQGRCAWPLEGGGVCGSTTRLELDHVDGFALGAETTAAACRLVCGWHNDLDARELYGDGLMNGYTRPNRGEHCSEPVAGYATTTATADHDPEAARFSPLPWRRHASCGAAAWGSRSQTCATSSAAAPHSHRPPRAAAGPGKPTSPQGARRPVATQ